MNDKLSSLETRRAAYLDFANRLIAAAVALTPETSMRVNCRNVGLNPDVLDVLAPYVTHANDGTNIPNPSAPNPWEDYLYAKLFGRYADDGQLTRLKRCLLSIPDVHTYTALIQDFTHETPVIPRPGRPEDTAAYELEVMRAKHELVADAYEFLSVQTRSTFIETGRSDIIDACNIDYTDLSAWNTRHIYVMDDLRRLPENQILSLPGMTCQLASEIYTWFRNHEA